MPINSPPTWAWMEMFAIGSTVPIARKSTGIILARRERRLHPVPGPSAPPLPFTSSFPGSR
jgi:hypothetical protein